MRVTDLQALFDYNAWANDRVLTTAAALTNEQFIAPARFPGASLRGCLVHILAALRFHLASWAGIPLHADLAASDFPDVASLATQWAREEMALRAFLNTLTDADLDQPRSLVFTGDGVRITAPMWKLMIHNINHATQHRSDAAQMLTDLSYSPGELDLSEILPVTPIEQ